MAELADAPDLGSGGEIRGGSSLSGRTRTYVNLKKPSILQQIAASATRRYLLLLDVEEPVDLPGVDGEAKVVMKSHRGLIGGYQLAERQHLCCEQAVGHKGG